MSHPCLEIVTYRAATPDEADRQRQSAAALARELPGFAGWLPLTAGGDRHERADVVAWASVEHAQSAARTVGAGEDFAPFRKTIDEVKGMGHFPLPGGGLPMMQGGDGVELGWFRLRPGIEEEAMRTAHARMVASHLSRQPGWRGQRLLRLQDETWIDLAFADSTATAESICASWADNADCQAFLAMIEPINMAFGAVA